MTGGEIEAGRAAAPPEPERATPAHTHTSGPWQADKHRVFNGTGTEQICNCYTGNAFANACLIAAAPSMLAALKRAKQFIENGVELGFIRLPDASTPDSAHETLPAIRAAIAAAEGR